MKNYFKLSFGIKLDELFVFSDLYDYIMFLCYFIFFYVDEDLIKKVYKVC